MPRLFSLLVLAVALLSGAEPAVDYEAASDAVILKSAGVGADAAGLLGFLRKRTPTDEDRAQVARLIRQLGSESFDDREAASRRLVAFGPTVLSALRDAINDADAELVRRARDAIQEIDSVRVGGLPAAAVRQMARLKPAGATAALLGFLPFADDEGVEEEVFAALLKLNPATAKADATLVPALTHRHPLVRAAAAHVLGRRADEVTRQTVHRLLADKDVRVRYRGAMALVTGRDRTAVPSLIDLLNEEAGSTAWQVEDALFRLAADLGPPGISIGVGGEDVRRKARDAWHAWWKTNGDKVDLAHFDDHDHLIGLTLGIEYNTGRVWECGPDGKKRWEITGLAGPMEAQVLPNNHVLIAESNNKTISERDIQGKVLWSKVLDREPTGIQRLPNGNTFVSSYNSAMEFDHEGRKLYDLGIGGSNAIRKARNGNVIFAMNGTIVEKDAKGKDVRSIPLPKSENWVGIRDLPGDRFLVCSSGSGRIFEVDAKGKVLWESKVPGVCGIAKLPNGHVLVGTANLALELDRDGKRVWQLPCPGYVRRIHRR